MNGHIWYIITGIPQLMLMLLANIKMATKSNYGQKICSAMHAICKKYTYNHMHDATLLQVILKELTRANSIWYIKDALPPGTGTVHLVTELVSYLQEMMGEDTNSAYTKSAYGVSSNSNLSKEERKPHASECKNAQRSKLQDGCRKQKEDKDNDTKKNTCPHCMKFYHKKPH
jgi:hypothetical protein